LNLIKEGYGMNKGIPITMIVSSSFDDIVAISIFGILRKLAI
jgi:hypothetical protein